MDVIYKYTQHCIRYIVLFIIELTCLWMTWPVADMSNQQQLVSEFLNNYYNSCTTHTLYAHTYSYNNCMKCRKDSHFWYARAYSWDNEYFRAARSDSRSNCVWMLFMRWLLSWMCFCYCFYMYQICYFPKFVLFNFIYSCAICVYSMDFCWKAWFFYNFFSFLFHQVQGPWN